MFKVIKYELHCDRCGNTHPDSFPEGAPVCEPWSTITTRVHFTNSPPIVKELHLCGICTRRATDKP